MQTSDAVPGGSREAAAIVKEELENFQIAPVASVVQRREIVLLCYVRQLVLLFSNLVRMLLLHFIDLSLPCARILSIAGLLFRLLFLANELFFSVFSECDLVSLVLEQESNHLVIVPQDGIVNGHHFFLVFRPVCVLLEVLMHEPFLAPMQQVLEDVQTVVHGGHMHSILALCVRMDQS